MLIPDQFIAIASKGDVRAAFERQAAEDWRSFLSLRATELRPGGRLVVVLPRLNDDGYAGFEPLFREANEALSEMAADGSITAEERAQMVLGAYPRQKSELFAPFTTDGQFCGLQLEHYELSDLADAGWAEYERDGNKDALVSRHAGFFRAIFVPSLASALTDGGNGAFADGLEKRLKRRLAAANIIGEIT
jgi:SAM dependent carboxyl methyltransferase